MKEPVRYENESAEMIASSIVSDLRKNFELDESSAKSIAWYTAITTRNAVTMYTGGLNLKWKLWDDVVEILKNEALDSINPIDTKD